MPSANKIITILHEQKGKENMTYILALDGYLKALQRLCGAGYVFGVREYPAGDDIDEFMNAIVLEWGAKNQYTYSGHKKINPRDVFFHIEEFVFNGAISKNIFQSNRVTIKMILEDINEYYGLMSTSIDAEGAFHPLIKGPVYQLKIDTGDFYRSFYFLVKINKYFVITYFKAPKLNLVNKQQIGC